MGRSAKAKRSRYPAAGYEWIYGITSIKENERYI